MNAVVVVVAQQSGKDEAACDCGLVACNAKYTESERVYARSVTVIIDSIRSNEGKITARRDASKETFDTSHRASI